MIILRHKIQSIYHTTHYCKQKEMKPLNEQCSKSVKQTLETFYQPMPDFSRILCSYR